MPSTLSKSPAPQGSLYGAASPTGPTSTKTSMPISIAGFGLVGKLVGWILGKTPAGETYAKIEQFAGILGLVGAVGIILFFFGPTIMGGLSNALTGVNTLRSGAANIFSGMARVVRDLGGAVFKVVDWTLSWTNGLADRTQTPVWMWKLDVLLLWAYGILIVLSDAEEAFDQIWVGQTAQTIFSYIDWPLQWLTAQAASVGGWPLETLANILFLPMNAIAVILSIILGYLWKPIEELFTNIETDVKDVAQRAKNELDETTNNDDFDGTATTSGPLFLDASKQDTGLRTDTMCSTCE